MAIESEAKRKKFDVQRSSTVERADKDFHEDDLNKDIHFNSVSENQMHAAPYFLSTIHIWKCAAAGQKKNAASSR